MKKMKRFVFKEGKVLQVVSPENKYSYIMAIKNDYFGTLFGIHKYIFDSPQKIQSLKFIQANIRKMVYINTASFNMRDYVWTVHGVSEVVDISIPPFYYGASCSSFTVEYPNGRQEYYTKEDIDNIPITPDFFKSRGIEQQILFFAEDIEAFIFCNTPLEWGGKW